MSMYDSMYELGGFAEDESVVDGDFNDYNFCLAQEYESAILEEDFSSLGEISNSLLDEIIYWLNYDGEIGKDNLHLINGINDGSIITINDRSFTEAIFDCKQVEMAATYINRGILNPKLYLTCILYGDEEISSTILNSVHFYIVRDKDAYVKFIESLFDELQDYFSKIEADRQLVFLSRLKRSIENIRYPKEYGNVGATINCCWQKQLVMVNAKPSQLD